MAHHPPSNLQHHMAGILETQQAHQLPGNLFPRSVPPWRQNHVLRDPRTTPVACTVQTEDQWGVVPPVVENGTLQGTLRNSHQISAANYGVAGYSQLPDLAVPYTYPDVGLAQGVPGPVQIPCCPENQGSDPFGNALCGPQVVPDHTRAALPDPSAQQAPALGQPAAENLRRLASRYLNHPDAQVDMVRMEPGTPGRCKVTVEIVLEMADI